MAISRARKEEIVEQYSELLNSSNGFAVVRTQGLNVNQIDTLRVAIRDAGGQYVVAKNTLLRIALEKSGWAIPEELLEGPVAVAYGIDNFPGVAKAILKYIEDERAEEKMKVTGGVMIEEVLNASAVESISKLPTLDELRAQLAGLVVAPQTGLVSVLYAGTAQVVNVVQAYLDDRGEDSDDAA